MIQRLLAPWTLLIISLWSSGSSQILQQEALKVLYPKLLSTEVISCDCVQISCDSIYWFRSFSNHSKLQFLGKYNHAGRATYGDGVETARLKLNRKNSLTFTLQIIDVTEEDAGIYSCVLRDKKNTEIWKTGILLQPGASPPPLPQTPMPKLTPLIHPVCRCPEPNPSHTDGCGSLVLWPLVGLMAATALVLTGTLYYFSRLPKKCRHQFVKKR